MTSVRKNRKPAAETAARAKTLCAATSQEMEAELLRRAIARTDEEIVRVIGVLDGMRAKQIARQHELAAQLARIAANANAGGDA
jgi:hypothetical protein